MEAMDSARKNAELEMRWSEYRDLEECKELSERLQEHKLMFSNLISNKRRLIGQLKD